mmetsp:Transcript_107135/g.302877  ORF Transcript_107135/g.302877 Transcript_107135/m.302877 type:complete len:325 (+) Transcript_107135:115-1089(+)
MWRGCGDAGDAGDGTSVGTGNSVGDDGENRATAGPRPRFALGTSTTSTASSAGAKDVGEGTSVGTGMSVGDDGAGAAERCLLAGDVGDGTAVGTGTACSGLLAGDVGDGTAVGTGISVGEDGIVPFAEDNAAGTSTASHATPGDVGDGSSVGTGISVGDDLSNAWGLMPVGGCGAGAAMRVGVVTALSVGVVLGDDRVFSTEDIVGTVVLVVRSVGTTVGTGTSASSRAPGDVGDGIAVGTGMSVGDDGGSSCAAAVCADSRTIGSSTPSSGCRAGDVGSRYGFDGSATVSTPPSSGAGDVGDGTTVGTAMSVGEDGAILREVG